MWFYVILLIVVVIAVGYVVLALQPQKVATGGGLDLFLGDVPPADAASREAAAAEELKRFGQVYGPSSPPGRQVLVLYASEYGFSEEVARKLFDRIVERGEELQLQPRLVNMRDALSVVDLTKEEVVLSVCSTTGDGVPPNDAREFFEWIEAQNAGLLPSLHYSTLALGDSSYPYYCRAARTLHQRYEDLGATAFVNRVDVDQEDWPVIDKWMNQVFEKLPSLPLTVRQDYITQRPDVGKRQTEKHNRSKPYWAKVLVKRPLTVPLTSEQLARKNYDEDKEVLHLEFELGEDSELTYTSGDAIGIYPGNNPPEMITCVRAFAAGKPLSRVKEMRVSVPRGAYPQQDNAEVNTLGDALRYYYDLKHVRPELLVFLQKSLDRLAAGQGSKTPEFAAKERAELKALLADGVSAKENAALRAYIREREVADVLEQFGAPYLSAIDPATAVPEILANMRMLQPRYYSIASSPTVDKRVAAVTAAVVRYATLNKDRTGVCTTFLADRTDIGKQVPVFISKNHDFRLPADTSRSIVMIGPGTGIAPFRGFLQERVLSEATGTNLFYFGCRKKDLDYLYKDELETWEKDGKVQLRTAFSREQAEKVYVQHRLLEDAANIWRLMEEGAHFYVCGDAGRMANDVHNALLSVIQSEGGKDHAQALAYMAALEKQKRYQRDVWVT
eukprot:TRINITY_DN429_c0_g1_i1.p1 TRINITY_DN429_c0_g1~~TRINITY_DN429_c0_g1_i1.p1  ORF type:complete len:673 (+),score=162.12 TRINITY_DN429_c0_g1_i1:70-2088(+)